ncbi:MAG: 6-carboxytetrahydropterin synthase QueD [Proteobacteria bacterium]|nr:6-carboxytetrahydropterin synthase QueD [Pseudomonadota bacterium]
MRTVLTRSYRIEAAHRLPKLPADHKCHRLHGHSFRVTLHVTGELDNRLDWVVDYASIDEAWRPLHDALDHRYLNEIPGLDNPTSEALARWIFERVKLVSGKLCAVSVAENCDSGCTVHGAGA